MHGTTILSVRKGSDVALVGDGQVTLGNSVVKPNANKLRIFPASGNIAISGFAGTTIDALTLYENLDAKLDEYSGQLLRACVELTKEWRTDKMLRQLQAQMIVCNKDISLILSGAGDVVDPVDGVIGIGSGGDYAASAARALLHFDLSARDIALRAMKIAGDMCIYTSHHCRILELGEDKEPPSDLSKAEYVFLGNPDPTAPFSDPIKLEDKRHLPEVFTET